MQVPRLEEWFQKNSHPSHSAVAAYTETLNKYPYRSYTIFITSFLDFCIIVLERSFQNLSRRTYNFGSRIEGPNVKDLSIVTKRQT